jgi:two-component system response regulator YesN
LSFIQKNYGNEISVAQIAKNLDLSPVYLNSVFKKELGKSIQEHLISVRIEKAKNLLLEQTQTISAVAKRVGYKSLRSFELAFFKRVGVSPTAYQAQHKLNGFILWKNHQDDSIAVDIAHYEKDATKKE